LLVSTLERFLPSTEVQDELIDDLRSRVGGTASFDGIVGDVEQLPWTVLLFTLIANVSMLASFQRPLHGDISILERQ